MRKIEGQNGQGSFQVFKTTLLPLLYRPRLTFAAPGARKKALDGRGARLALAGVASFYCDVTFSEGTPSMSHNNKSHVIGASDFAPGRLLSVDCVPPAAWR